MSEEEKEEEDSELEEEIIKEIEKNSIHEISNNFTQETGDVVVEEEKLKDFITQSFSSRRFSPSLEKIQEVQQQRDIEQNFNLGIETLDSQRMYGAVAKEEKRLYDSRSRSMEPLVLTSNNTSSQRTKLIDPLARMNLSTQNNMQQKMIQTQTSQRKQRLPFEREVDNKYKEVKL